MAGLAALTTPAIPVGYVPPPPTATEAPQTPTHGGAAHHDAAHLGILGVVLQDADEGVPHVERHGIQLGGVVEYEMADGALVLVAPGNGSVANVDANPTVTVLFPPSAPRGFTLLVDGTAQASGDDVRVTPTSAVLHRPADHADGPPPPEFNDAPVIEKPYTVDRVTPAIEAAFGE